MRRLAAVPTTIRALTVALLTLGMLGAACSPAAPPLVDHDYLSVGVTEGGAARQLVNGTRIRLNFGASDLGVNAGCNHIGGTYRIEGGRLIFEGAGMTMMGCDPALHAQDEWLSTFLSSEPLIRLVANDLTLEGATTVIRLLDTEVAEPDLNLVGPTWTVESIITGDAVSSIPQGAAATFVFRADGTLELRPGCNTGGGTWKLEGTGLRISEVIMTKMACEGPGGELESAVLQVLAAGPLTATIDASVLTLQGAGGGLQLRGG
jgi:heat shock protein HslJ